MHHPRFLHHSVSAPLNFSGSNLTRKKPRPFETGENSTFTQCKLFGDKVPKHLCEIRRAELNNKGDFSCTGCFTDMMLTLQEIPAKAANGN
jgi:hypothetical protein